MVHTVTGIYGVTRESATRSVLLMDRRVNFHPSISPANVRDLIEKESEKADWISRLSHYFLA